MCIHGVMYVRVVPCRDVRTCCYVLFLVVMYVRVVPYRDVRTCSSLS